MSPQRSQLARPAEQHGKNSKRRATPEPITAQVSQWATDQAQCILQLFEAGAHRYEQGAGGGTFSISTAAVLKLLTDEFSNNNPEDGRYTPQQRMQGSESSPATTGEFNCTLNVVVHKVHQPWADKETSSAYVRCRAAQEQLSQSAPTLCEHVKTEPVAPPLVDSNYAHSQQWQEEFCNCMTLQHLWLADIQATSCLQVLDQNIIFDQNGILQDSNNF